MKNHQRLSNVIREHSPCDGCTERFIACQDRCPKDARGGFGIKAWKAEIKRVKKAMLDYLKRTSVRRKDFHWGNEDGE
jgi:hypothetical protein